MENWEINDMEINQNATENVKDKNSWETGPSI